MAVGPRGYSGRSRSRSRSRTVTSSPRPKTYQQALREGERKRGSNFSPKNFISDFKMAIGAKPKSGLYKLQTRRGIDRLRNPEPTAAEKVRAMSRSIGRSDDRIEREKAQQASMNAMVQAAVDQALAAQTQQAPAAPVVTTPEPPAVPTATTPPGPAETDVIETAEAANKEDTKRKKTAGRSAPGLLSDGSLRRRTSLMSRMIT